MENNFLQRTELLIGEESLKKLANSKILVFGVGGVGGYVVEGLVRAGIGEITVVDFDTIDITNINRQIIALHSNIGAYKVDIIEQRIKDINPKCKVIKFKEKLVPDNIDKFSLKEYDYIVDAIDSVQSKIALAEYCYNNNINLFSSMGAGNKLDPKKFKVSDISKTSVCPLARTMRVNLKKKNVKKLKVIWSDELPKKNNNTNNGSNKTPTSSISFVPSVAGLIISGEIINELISKEDYG
ncbi:MAG: tRNA threonylcarbamoyladenosine dehydratase [Miniphocaeibacter sp.]|uniref:tRNA threonylcarbamoyladenosine dehydratase n=1 Tax=Miniphocaeibacter sp. TaxID=3100973 RepID=UPI0017A833F0|nr:tRNA threonylcarbamoyladenosine dehydratase [Gallicola sp.]